MLKIKVKKRHIILASSLTVTAIATAGSVYAMTFYTNQQIASQVATSTQELKKLDVAIAEIKAEKIAEKKAQEEAKRKAEAAAKKKAASDAALKKQLAGQVVTPASCAVSGAHGNPNSIDVVINKKNCLNPINFVPSDLVSYGGYLLSNKVYPNLVAMIKKAATDGKVLSLASAYRSYSNQITTYNQWVAVNGSYAAADKVSARPGYSEHQTGFAIDFSGSSSGISGFASTPEYAWMKSNAHKYGFIQRYKSGHEATTGYSAEAWHWRYVGKTVATDMRNKGIHTLEKYWNIEGGSY